MSTTYAAPWRYRPLDESSHEIRLIRSTTQPSGGDSEVILATGYDSITAPTQERKQCPELIIESFPLASAPPYTAFSYLWGSGVRDKSVTCSGGQLHVTSNLEYILRRLTLFPGWYWADAICINQGDISEKSSQVQLMFDIYRSAKEVVAFVGDPPGNLGVETLIALSVLGEMSKNGKLTTKEGRKTAGPHLARYINLIARPYFSRGWIIQEAAVNVNCSLWYGNADIPFDIFSRVIQYNQDESGLFTLCPIDALDSNEPEIDLQENKHNFRQVDTIHRLRTSLKNREKIPLCRALALGRTSRVTDARDKIFAFLGFTEPEVRRQLKPDYSPENNIEKVLIQCASVGIASEQAPEILMLAGHTDLKLPSWVPDWTNYPCNTFQTSRYQSAGSSSPVICVDPKDSNAIIIRAAVVDRVSKLLRARRMPLATTHPPAACMDDCPLPPGLIESQRAWFMSLLSDIAYCWLAAEYISKPYPTGEPAADVVWRTVIGDTGLASMGFRRPVGEIDRLRAAAFSHLYRKKRVAEPFRMLVDGTDETDLFSLADAYHQQSAYIQEGRRGGMTRNRYLTVLPDTAEPDDLVVLALGVNMPLIMTRIMNGDRAEYKLKGPAYVHGIMDGELMEQTIGGKSNDWTVKGAVVEDMRIV